MVEIINEIKKELIRLCLLEPISNREKMRIIKQIDILNKLLQTTIK